MAASDKSTLSTSLKQYGSIVLLIWVIAAKVFGEPVFENLVLRVPVLEISVLEIPIVGDPIPESWSRF